MSAPGYTQVPALSGQQSNALNQLLSLLMGQGAEGVGASLQNLLGLISGSPESFEAFERPALRQFEEQIVPGLQERITALGGGGGRSSGGAQILAQAGERLEEGLAGQRAQLQQSAIQQLLSTYLGGLGLGLGTSPFAYLQNPAGFGTSLGQGLGQGLGMIPGLFF